MIRSLSLAALLCLALFVATPALAQRGVSNAVARAALNRNLPAIDFQNVTLREAIEFLRDVSGANVHVNWRAIELTGVTPDTTVNMRLRQVPMRRVLSMLLDEAAGGQLLTWYLDDGVIEITTREISDSIMYTKVYDVQDLLFEPPEFIEPPDFDLSQYTDQGGGRGGGGGGGRGGGGGGGGGGGRGLFQTANQTSEQTEPRDPKAKANELIELIQAVVYPDVWVEAGGKSSIRFFNGNLIITAPRSVHEAIGGPID